MYQITPIALLCWCCALATQAQQHALILTPEAQVLERAAFQAMAGETTRLTAASEDGVRAFGWKQGDARITVTIKEDYEHDSFAPRMQQWFKAFPDAERQRPAAKQVNDAIASTRQVYACLIQPGTDAKGQIIDTLLALTQKTNGQLFLNDAFYDTRGYQGIGLPGSPYFLVSPNQLKTAHALTAAEIQGAWEIASGMMDPENNLRFDIAGRVTYAADGSFKSQVALKLMQLPDALPLSIIAINRKGTWKIKASELRTQTAESKVVSVNSKDEQFPGKAFTDALEQVSDRFAKNRMFKQADDVLIGLEVEQGVQFRLTRKP